MLEVLGVDRWGEAVYLAMIDGPALTEAELISRTGIEPGELPAVLAVLAESGLIYRSREHDPVRYAALPPDTAVDVLLLAREREFSQVRALAHHLGRRHRQGSGGAADLVEVIVGADGVAQCGRQLLRGARREIRGIDAPPYARHSDGLAVGSAADVLGRGVRSRFIHDRSTLRVPGRARLIEEEMSAGEEARVLPGVPMKMLIADDGPAVVPLTSDPAVLDACILVHPSPLLDALVALFETLWLRAQPFVPARVPAPAPVGAVATPATDQATGPAPVLLAGADVSAGPRLSAEQRQIISLLALGLSDEAIARQAGLGLRTVQRRIQALMTELGATSRFQAGVLAARHGW